MNASGAGRHGWAHMNSGQFHEERDKVKIKIYVCFHCKLIALTQRVLHVLGKNMFILLYLQIYFHDFWSI